MQVHRLMMERYKPFRGPTELEIRPLTILVGRNNSGKTALARALPLFAGSLMETRPDAPPVPLESCGLVHGDRFEDLVTGRAVHGSLRLSAEFSSEAGTVTLGVKVQNLVDPGRQARQVVQWWELGGPGKERLKLERPRLEENAYRVFSTSAAGEERSSLMDVDWQGLLPLERLAEVAGWITPWIECIASWARGVRYMRSPRRLVASPFATPARMPARMAADGREAVMMLAASDDLLRRVQRWYENAFGVRLDLSREAEASSVRIRSAPGAPAVSISNAGQGLTQVLPVVVQCMTAQDEGPGIDVVEQPESELHPQAHSAVADLLIEHLPGGDRPLVVETHSEVVLLRVRRRIAEGTLHPEQVAVYWVEMDDEGDASLRKVGLTAAGEVENWPEGVFLEDYEEIIAIRRAARVRRG